MPNLTNEKNTLMLISLMKAHGVRKVVASPGTTNVAFVASIQQDDYFEVYSAYDERSAAYMACGLSAESGEPVVLSCTQATASRNYLPGLTEAFYRNLPILAVTSTQHWGRIGQNCQQAIDRTVQPVDTVKLSVQVPVIHTEEDEWYCNVLLNRALLELRRNGNGPIHINLTTEYSREFPVQELPSYRVIRRIDYKKLISDECPAIPDGTKVAIFVGAHVKWSNRLEKLVDEFCSLYNAVVLCDAVSNYKGAYRVDYGLVASQQQYRSPLLNIDLLIHMGDVSGAPNLTATSSVWRVHPDGEIRDTFRKQSYVFELEEDHFFEKYIQLAGAKQKSTEYLDKWRYECDRMWAKIPELPFSNGWLAQNTISRLPQNSILHLGIYNSLRYWSLFEAPQSVLEYSNTGGFGIDGCVSSMVGAALATDALVFGVVGDLAFFYDMNALSNRHVKNNLRLLVVNNGLGTEFKNTDNRAYKLGDLANPYIAAQGHNGKQSRELIKHYVQDLGFKYLSAESKTEYLEKLPEFLDNAPKEQPIVFEVFTDTNDETETHRILYNLEISATSSAKNMARAVIGDTGMKTIKKILGK